MITRTYDGYWNTLFFLEHMIITKTPADHKNRWSQEILCDHRNSWESLEHMIITRAHDGHYNPWWSLEHMMVTRTSDGH